MVLQINWDGALSRKPKERMGDGVRGRRGFRDLETWRLGDLETSGLQGIVL